MNRRQRVLDEARARAARQRWGLAEHLDDVKRERRQLWNYDSGELCSESIVAEYTYGIANSKPHLFVQKTQDKQLPPITLDQSWMEVW